jgi:hypothetical protein
MLKFDKIIKINEIPMEMWARYIYPEDVKEIKPIESELTVLYFNDRGKTSEQKIQGNIGSSAWFSGMGYHGESIHKEFSNINDNGKTIFYNYNNNNGQNIIFVPKKGLREDFYFENMEIIPVPFYDTWQPKKVVVLAFFNDKKRKEHMTLFKETLELVEKFYRNKLDHMQDLGVYLATAGYFKRNSYFVYIHSANFLRTLEFDISEFEIPKFVYQGY